MPDLTIAAALVAGVVSFLSPCVLPVVPAYLGQLGIVAAANTPWVVTPTAGPPVQLAPRSRRAVLSHALAFVLGFGIVFTLLGVTFYVAAGPIRDLTIIRQIGGVILIILGLNLMGVIRIGLLNRTLRPGQAEFGQAPLGGAAARSPLGAFALGTIFAIGWTPCIGPTLGAILTLSALAVSPQVVLLLIAYSIGLGVPFLLLALAVDRSAGIIRPLLRYGRQIELIGGGLVVLIGLAILLDWLSIFARAFSFLWPQV